MRVMGLILSFPLRTAAPRQAPKSCERFAPSVAQFCLLGPGTIYQCLSIAIAASDTAPTRAGHESVIFAHSVQESERRPLAAFVLVRPASANARPMSRALCGLDRHARRYGQRYVAH